jgi:hypothetical protein
MVPAESEIAQPHPCTYLEYMGGIDYGANDMEEGDELPPVKMEMETEEVPMPSVQVDSECLDSFILTICFEVFSM